MRKHLLRRLLFKLHIVNTYPITIYGMPATILRTNKESEDIKPDAEHYTKYTKE